MKRILNTQQKSCCKAFVARKVHIIAWAKCEKAVIWQATNAINGMGTVKIPLPSIRSEEGPHYCRGAKREEAVRRQLQSTLFTSLDILWWFHTRDVLRSLAKASVSLRKVKKQGVNPVQSNGRSQQKPSAKSRKRENSMVVMLLPGSHERLASRNPCVLFQKHGGACTMY